MSQRWKICDHAKQRLDEMGLSRRDVLTALKQREVEYPGSLRHPEGRRVACWDRLAVVFNPATRTVITVLWRGIEFVRPSVSRARAHCRISAR
ncbi:MAG TPA: hypothetical protein VGB52_04155 [Actinomycetota bacterium]